jgi:hypothetical protein
MTSTQGQFGTDGARKNVVLDLATVVSDADFQRFSALQLQPNLFRALGRTFTETWHSAFLGWLLDPGGSHSLGGFPLQRFLTAAARSELVPEQTPMGFLAPSELALLAATRNFGDASVMPSEQDPVEMALPSGRADVWIQLPAIVEGSGGQVTEPEVKFVVEMKVDAALGVEQCRRYANDLRQAVGSVAGNAKVAAIFVARTDSMAATSTATVDDPHWYCIDFQILHDEVVVPCAEHPNLSPHMRGLIQHYLLNLRDPRGRRGRMAFTKEEKQLARAIFERHRATFVALADILGDEEGFPKGLVEIDADPGQPAAALSLQVGADVIAGTNVPDLLDKVIRYIWSHGRALPQVPYICGRKRYLFSATPVHQDGSRFISAKPFQTAGGDQLYLETNFSRLQAVSLAAKLLAESGFEARPVG